MIALMLLCTSAAPSWAGELETAEHTRLSEEIRRLAQRAAWGPVEANYLKLEALEAKGEVLTFDELRLGFESARALGNITAARARLAKAVKLKDEPELINALSDIDGAYGAVEITFDKRYAGARELTVANPPFDPIQRSAITYAIGRMQAGENFIGLLPAGQYGLAGRTFTATPGEGNVAKVAVVPQAGEKTQSGLAYVGPRISIGLSLTSAMDAAEATDVQPAAFGGLGARGGVGLEVGISKTFELIGEIGYHSLFAAPGVDVAENADPGLNTMHLGYGFFGAGLRFGDVWLSAGPVYSLGVAQVTQDYCTAVPDCGAEVGQNPYGRFKTDGLIRLGGAEANLSYALVGLGTLDGAITLSGGAQTDMARLYPWGQLAFTIAPSGQKPKKTASAGGT